MVGYSETDRTARDRFVCRRLIVKTIRESRTTCNDIVHSSGSNVRSESAFDSSPL
jgi:hypothetical protein